MTAIAGAALFTAVKGILDPFCWMYYLAFSMLVFYGSAQFKRWVSARSEVLDEEVDLLGKTLEGEKTEFREHARQAEFFNQKANEIIELYEKIKEMSKSLDRLETFLVFGEALSGNFKFQVMKLAFFNEKHPTPLHPEEIYELRAADFEGVFDRSAYLRDPKKAKGETFPFDQKIFEHLLKEKAAYRSDGPNPFVAYPILMHQKVFAVLTVLGIHADPDPLLTILIERFISEIQRVKLYQGVETLATTDGLTGVYVRRHLMDRLEGEMDRAMRFGLKLSFLMIDIDYFKNFNDSYGHLVGDVVLKQVTQTIKKNTREVDLVGRYGGEEFGVVLVETDEPAAMLVAERIRRSIEERSFRAYDENLKVTVSIGCSTYSREINGVNLLIDTADSALYQAKRQGRNKVCLFQS